MTGSLLRFEHEYDLAPEVVWDALIDADLVGGWLAEAEIDARIGGRYDLQWHAPIALGTTIGEIADLLEPELLCVELERVGVVTFVLTEIAGDSRARATRLTVTIDSSIESLLSDGLSATWLTALSQLERLLRGHPVDWTTWQRDHGGEWIANLDGVRSA